MDGSRALDVGSRFLTTLVVCVLVVLAGCGVPFASDGGDHGATATGSSPHGPTDERAPGPPAETDRSDAARSPRTAATSTDRETQTAGGSSTAERTPTSAEPATPEATPTPTPTPTPTETPTPRPNERVVGESDSVTVEGSLPVNATVVYRRVERLMNATIEAPTVVVKNFTAPGTGSLPPPPVHRALGFGTSSGAWQDCGPLVVASAEFGQVTVSTRGLSQSSIELVLAHEFAHVLQRDVDGYGVRVEDPTSGTYKAITEGTAVYVTDAYAREYDKRLAGKRPLELRECFYDRAENRVRELTGRYYFGARYVAERLEDPSQLERIFENPPRTSEQLVHGLDPATEPPAPLSVTVDAAGSWELDRRLEGGELLVRVWLATELTSSRVDAAASGFGNGTLLSLRDGNATSAAWILRWDTPEDADEFEAAGKFLESQLETLDRTQVRQVRVSDETVVVFAGGEPFVENATASGTDGNVTVTTPR